MKLQKVIATTLIGLAGLCSNVGCECESKQSKSDNVKSLQKDYFTEIPMYYKSGMALTSGDFDGDGDLDFIAVVAGTKSSGFPNGNAELYFFENVDGKGNFKKREGYHEER
ncbi:hypothetical protein HY450_00360 [Candidatus Pacearchaeota archaeon]|nr:hypothetical protein [Candidatus Pacearchaeota archaeon]